MAGRLGIRGKILIYLAMLVGFMLSLVWLFQSALLYEFYQGSRTSQLRSTARLLAQNVDSGDVSALADRLSEENDLAIVLVNGAGETLFSVGHTRYTPFETFTAEEALRWAERAPEDGSALVEGWSGGGTRAQDDAENAGGKALTGRRNRSGSMMCLQRVTFAAGDRGTLFIFARVTPVPSVTETSRKQLIVIAVALLIAAALVGFSMAQSVSEPIIETNRAALELSRSRYTRPAHSGGYREIAELNDTLVRAAEDLRKVEDLQRELIANISHDLRTPLTMIQGYAEAMRDIPSENTPENMQIIIDETNRLSSMVNEVLDFSRMRTGSLELTETDFDLTGLIRTICGRVSKMSGVEGYQVVFEDTEPCYVHADSGRISQVVYNLIGNALTYTGEDRTVRVTEQRRGSRMRVTVADSGEGISREELPHIWDRYYRSRENHRRSIIGSGLGLNICRGILETHHAPYGVESEVGQGTSFWFELPVHTPPEAEQGGENKNGEG